MQCRYRSMGQSHLKRKNPPIILRQVDRHLRNMHPKVFGYTVLNIKSSIYDQNCSYLFHPRVDMLSITRIYRRDALRVCQKKPQHAMATLDALEKENILDMIRFLALHETILCQIPWSFLPPTRFELADPSLSNLHHGYLPNPPPDLETRGHMISHFLNLELLLSVNTRCDHPVRSSMDLDNIATEFERCFQDGPRRKFKAHSCLPSCHRVHNYITTQALRDDGTSPRVLMVHDAHRSSPSGDELWRGNWID
ncbi:hypothetical protein BKA64DRAFT_778457 [Cadophora sp. MPI-SDFR-AT-0126]|nr:hypothetical protein BKA64DRAFT_778457 [Leotiomycetes sp. MPI-SDFR-AT-0126]